MEGSIASEESMAIGTKMYRYIMGSPLIRHVDVQNGADDDVADYGHCDIWRRVIRPVVIQFLTTFWAGVVHLQIGAKQFAFAAFWAFAGHAIFHADQIDRFGLAPVVISKLILHSDCRACGQNLWIFCQRNVWDARDQSVWSFRPLKAFQSAKTLQGGTASISRTST